MRGADPRFVRLAGNGDLLGAYEARRGVASLFLSALPLRLLTDFVTRPPRIAAEWLQRIWDIAHASDTEVVDLEPLAALKLTNREKGHTVAGELPPAPGDHP